MQELTIDKSFEGIPGVPLGGYVAGLAAKDLGRSVAVTLTKPIPPIVGAGICSISGQLLVEPSKH